MQSFVQCVRSGDSFTWLSEANHTQLKKEITEDLSVCDSRILKNFYAKRHVTNATKPTKVTKNYAKTT